jgi:glycosyltransferase involved in cell wall biosynthesis
MHKENKLNVLFLTFWTPPAVRPRAIAIGKLMPEFIKQGLNPFILTYDNGGEWGIDAPIYKISQFKIHSLPRILKLRSILKLFYYWRIFKQSEKIIKDHHIDVVFSFSNPQESNLVGAMLRKILGVPFISYFSDPWYDNSYKKFSKLAAKKVLHLERFIIKNSDRAVFINGEERDLVMKKYPKSWQEKTRVAYHCYSPDDYPKIQKNSDGKYLFSHIGVFYKERNPEVFLRAAALAISRDQSLKTKIKIQFIGGTTKYGGYSQAALDDLIRKYNLQDLVETLPQVGYKESLGYMESADCLIVIDSDVPNSISLPSKLFDYAGSGTPIIGITPKHSPTQGFLSKLGYRSFAYQQVDELADYINKSATGGLSINLNREFLVRFKAANIAADYINVFYEIAAKE